MREIPSLGIGAAQHAARERRPAVAAVAAVAAVGDQLGESGLDGRS